LIRKKRSENAQPSCSNFEVLSEGLLYLCGSAFVREGQRCCMFATAVMQIRGEFLRKACLREAAAEQFFEKVVFMPRMTRHAP